MAGDDVELPSLNQDQVGPQACRALPVRTAWGLIADYHLGCFELSYEIAAFHCN